MAKSYGGVYDDSPDGGTSVFAQLVTGGEAEFNALLGGNREVNGAFRRLDAHGFYWTLTEFDSVQAWFYNFAGSSKLLNRHTGDKTLALSVRCIRERNVGK